MSEERLEKGQTPPPPTRAVWTQREADLLADLDAMEDERDDAITKRDALAIQVDKLRKVLEECTGPESGCLHHSTCRARAALEHP